MRRWPRRWPGAPRRLPPHVLEADTVRGPWLVSCNRCPRHTPVRSPPSPQCEGNPSPPAHTILANQIKAGTLNLRGGAEPCGLPVWCPAAASGALQGLRGRRSAVLPSGTVLRFNLERSCSSRRSAPSHPSRGRQRPAALRAVLRGEPTCFKLWAGTAFQTGAGWALGLGPCRCTGAVHVNVPGAQLISPPAPCGLSGIIVPVHAP